MVMTTKKIHVYKSHNQLTRNFCQHSKSSLNHNWELQGLETRFVTKDTQNHGNGSHLFGSTQIIERIKSPKEYKSI